MNSQESLTTEKLLVLLEKDKTLNEAQRQAISQVEGPVWILAGPGSGKTETLVLRTLNLLLVHRVPPRAIFLTTFTRKAARNLLSRLIDYKSQIEGKVSIREAERIRDINVMDIYIGTLHSLAWDILREFGQSDLSEKRLMEEIETLFFVYVHLKKDDIDAVWNGLKHLRNSRSGYVRGWSRINTVLNLMNRIVEDRINPYRDDYEEEWVKNLIQLYHKYKKTLDRYNRIDFAHVQKDFLDFLESSLGRDFLEGDGSLLRPGIQYVMVDEYQDTNPIQEAIYFKLAARTGNLCVVGDDDQAIYRFRGGTVACMLRFPDMAKRKLGKEPETISLSVNYRSVPAIVDYINDYINKRFPQSSGVRAPKKPLQSARDNTDVCLFYINPKKMKRRKDVAEAVAEVIQKATSNNYISNYAECAILLRSTRVSKISWTRYIQDALEKKGIPYYNPRNRAAQNQEEIQLILQVFKYIVSKDDKSDLSSDSKLRHQGKDFLEKVLSVNVSDDMKKAIKLIRIGSKKRKIEWLQLFYYFLAIEPLSKWKDEAFRAERLGMFSSLLEAFSLTPRKGKEVGQDHRYIYFRSKSTKSFWEFFTKYIEEEGLNDPEDEDIVVPEGHVPIMTIHQAKGLEFRMVFVVNEEWSSPSIEHTAEHVLRKYAYESYIGKSFLPEELARHDSARLHYVAYSRAKDCLFVIERRDGKYYTIRKVGV